MKKFLISLLAFFPAVASASDDQWGINDFTSTNIALGSKPLRDTIGGVVNIVLGFLGILATLIILLGGFKWMTSQGNTEKVDEAKKLIGAGIVGLVIILTAYAISRFVLQSLYNETI
ncbi:pilin [Patescibacteria group bacterium]|nr:pilin [Patescibacteria group bacterium]